MNYKLIEQAMQAEIDGPRPYYMPNSPGCFVRDRLFKMLEWEEAAWFWGCYCRGNFNVPQLDALLPKLKELTAKEQMPDWGTYGT